jgi:histidinol-phosphatase
MSAPSTATRSDDALYRGLTDDLRLAHLLADDADSITMSRFKALDLHVTTKPDLTPVSDADTAVEEALRRTLSRARPRDAVHGEELDDVGWGPRRWVIDPIDGTKNFVRGVPVWGTLIALMINDESAVGVVSAPALGRRWWASLGGGAYAGKSLMSASRIHVSDVASLEDASLSYASISAWVESGQGQQFVDLLRACWRTRAYGDFWSYMLLAEGGVDIACEPQLALHDMAACAVIVTEAGGRFTDLDGRPGPLGAGAYATNGRLHDALLAQLSD